MVPPSVLVTASARSLAPGLFAIPEQLLVGAAVTDGALVFAPVVYHTPNPGAIVNEATEAARIVQRSRGGERQLVASHMLPLIEVLRTYDGAAVRALADENPARIAPLREYAERICTRSTDVLFTSCARIQGDAQALDAATAAVHVQDASLPRFCFALHYAGLFPAREEVAREIEHGGHTHTLIEGRATLQEIGAVIDCFYSHLSTASARVALPDISRETCAGLAGILLEDLHPLLHGQYLM